MHDIDRTSMETFEYDFESEAEGEGYLFNEAEVAELASELMEVNGEQELEQFLGDLLKKAASAAGSFMKSSTGKAFRGHSEGRCQESPAHGRWRSRRMGRRRRRLQDRYATGRHGG